MHLEFIVFEFRSCSYVKRNTINVPAKHFVVIAAERHANGLLESQKKTDRHIQKIKEKKM